MDAGRGWKRFRVIVVHQDSTAREKTVFQWNDTKQEENSRLDSEKTNQTSSYGETRTWKRTEVHLKNGIF